MCLKKTKKNSKFLLRNRNRSKRVPGGNIMLHQCQDAEPEVKATRDCWSCKIAIEKLRTMKMDRFKWVEQSRGVMTPGAASDGAAPPPAVVEGSFDPSCSELRGGHENPTTLVGPTRSLPQRCYQHLKVRSTRQWTICIIIKKRKNNCPRIFMRFRHVVDPMQCGRKLGFYYLGFWDMRFQQKDIDNNTFSKVSGKKKQFVGDSSSPLF